MASPELPTISQLSAEQELFCSFRAAGKSSAESARLANVHHATGYRWLQLPEIQARIQEFVDEHRTEDLGGLASRAWIETHMVMVVEKIERGGYDPLDLEGFRVELTALMNLAKLKGLIVERKQVDQRTAKLDLNKLVTPEAQEQLGGVLDGLEPGTRRMIEDRVKALGMRSKTRKAIEAELLEADPA